jgi:hypothetical protein
MSQLPFFTWHNILCAAVVSAVGVRACVRACGVFFTPAVLPSHSHVVAVHNNIRYARQHGVRSARLPRFGEMFQWRKSSVCCFGACGAVKRQFHSRRRQRRLLHSQRQQMAALNFVNFFFVK